jgi:hypothetical protein
MDLSAVTPDLPASTQQLLLQLLSQLAQSSTATTDAIQQALQTPKKREKLPALSKFNGSRSKFEDWELEARNKLATDGETIGTPLDQMNYIYAALEGNARSMSRAYTETTSKNSTGTGGNLLDYLKRNYGDPNRNKRAMDKLQRLQQLSNESFAKFLPRFETLMADAGILGLEDAIKISMLEKALNRTMKWSLVNANTPETFAEYVSLLQTIGSRLDSLKQPVHPTPQSQKDDMDWESTFQQNQGQTRKHAHWVSKDEISERRNNNRCLRCGEAGHFIRQCTLLPPRRPLASNKAQQEENSLNEINSELGKE